MEKYPLAFIDCFSEKPSRDELDEIQEIVHRE